MPTSLLLAAVAAERRRLRVGFDGPHITPIGIDGVSIGYASWSGVSYLPLSPTRAITPAELVDHELLVQALWCYTAQISHDAGNGSPPTAIPEFGRQFLRACHIRLTSAGPTESAQLRIMRDAILDTSRLVAQLLATQEILREVAPAGR